MLYYVHTDNLGSIQVITNESGNIEAEYAYTAWGGRIALIESPLGDSGVVRGYTGHEHLEPLGLINMNGRIYDPVLARFLSPDPYVQAPDFTQGFNRYSYCLNNPFKYTDPSGDFLVEAFLIGGMVNLAIQAASGNIDSLEKFFTSFAIGGVAGVAGAGVGSLIGGTLNVATSLGGAVGNGALIGAAGGAVGGFVGGAGNSWMNGSSFKQGLINGVTGAGFGAVSGGIIGGVTGGIQFHKQDVNFRKMMSEMGMDEGAPLTRSDVVLNNFTEYWYKSRGYDHYFQYIDEYTTENIPADIVKKMAANKATGATVGKGNALGLYSERSSVYFSELAFKSARQLYFTIGHELVHVGQNAYLADIGFVFNADDKFLSEVKEVGAHGWESFIGKNKMYTPNRKLLSDFMKAYPSVAEELIKISNYSIHLPTHNPIFYVPPKSIYTLPQYLRIR